MTRQELSHNAFAEESLIFAPIKLCIPKAPRNSQSPLLNATIVPSTVASAGLLFNKARGQTDSDLITECLLIINRLLPGQHVYS